MANVKYVSTNDEKDEISEQLRQNFRKKEGRTNTRWLDLQRKGFGL